MDALTSTLSTLRVRREDSTKLFYKRYPYRVVLDALKMEKLAYAEICEAYADRMDVKFRKQGGFINCYFQSESETDQFVNEHRTHIVSVAMPSSREVLQAISDDTRIEVRDTLYWNKYRWAAVCKSLDEEQIDELRDWLNSYKEQCGETNDDKIQFAYSSSSPRVYFSDEDDLFMFKFSFFNRISRLEKVLLKKEIADEQFIAEGSH
jgi:hypothetical protein